MMPRGWAITFVGMAHGSLLVVEISSFKIGSAQKTAYFALQAQKYTLSQTFAETMIVLLSLTQPSMSSTTQRY